jgi:surface protein
MINRLINLISLFTVTSIQIFHRIKQSTFIVLTVFLLSACSSDSSEKESEVETGDGIGPVITLSGEPVVDWPQGFDYRDPYASSYDEADDQSYGFLLGTGVDVSVVGTQTLTYTISDSEGNEGVATRTVNIYTPIPFITTWTTTEANQSITIPTFEFFTYYDFLIDWGDGSEVDTHHTGDATHIYSTAGTYTVSITGIFPHMYNDENNSIDKLMSVEQWGNIRWGSMNSMFEGAYNLVINAIDAPMLSDVEEMQNMFEGASSFNTDISDWDVSNVTDMRGVFADAESFNQPLDSWDVSNVTTMQSMFFGAAAFNQPIDGWDVSNVTAMEWMFYNTAVFNQPLNSWDVSNVANMGSMFYTAESFNQPLDSWDVSNVANMGSMFSSAAAFNQPLESWDVSNVTSMTSMFSNAAAFNQPLDSWDVSNVTDMHRMFWQAAAFNQNVGNWDVSNVADVRYMFDESGLSSENYDALLNGWSIQILPSSLTFDVSAKYSSASEAARQSIIDTYNWTINDDGLLVE